MQDNSNNARLKVLIVDDEGDNVELVHRTLREQPGVDTLTANSPHEAISIFNAENVSLIILDYKMPKMTGIELLQNLRLMGRRPAAIMVTGYPDEPDVVRGVESGIVDRLVPKPWKSEALLEALSTVLADLRSRES